MWNLVFVLNLLLHNPSFAGDSLTLELKKTRDPALKASIYFTLAKNYYGTDQDLAIAYADSSLSFSKQADIPKLMANALNIKAVAYLIKSDFETSMRFNLESLKIREAIQDTVGLIESHLNIGNILYRTKKSDEAVDRYQKALVYAEVAKNQRGLSLLFNNIGSYYKDKWRATKRSSDLDSAKVYLVQSMEIKTKLNDLRGLITTFNQLSELARGEKKYMLAESYLNRGLEVSKGIEDSELQISLLNQLSEFNLEVGDKIQALDYAKKAFEIAEKMKSTFMISNSSGYVADAYEAVGDFQKAFQFIKRKLEVDQILNDENKQKIQEDLLIRYESEKKELENRRLLEEQRFLDLSIQRKNELLIGAAIIVIILIGVGLLQRKKNNELAEAQKQLQYVFNQLTEKNLEIEQNSYLLLESNKALRESKVTRERLLSVVSHDLITPLNSLNFLLDFWENKDFSAKEIEEILPKISRQTKSVQSLLEHLLEWTQTQMEFSKLKFENVNLRSLAEESISFVRTIAEEKKLIFVNEVPNEVSIYSDRARLNFIIRNLVSNAIKFTPAEGQILIAFVSAGKGKIQVVDNGIGIPKSRLGLLFSQSTGPSKGTEGEIGSGVGLLLCKEFAESLGAKLEVISEVEKGSTFTVNLG